MVRPPRNPAQTAALASLLAPLLAIGVSVLSNAQKGDPSTDRIVTLAQGGITVLVIVIGFGAGVAALVMMAKYGRQGVLGRAITGLVLNVGFLALVAAGFLAAHHAVARQRASTQAFNAAMQQLDAQQGDLIDQAERAIEGEDVSQESAARLSNVGQSLRQQTQHMTGQDKAAAEILGRIMEQMGSHVEYHGKAVAALSEANVMDPSTATSAQVFDERISVMDEATQRNEAMDAFFAGIPASIERDLIASNFTPGDARAAAGKWAHGANLDTLKGLRDTDRRILRAMRELQVIWRDNLGVWQVAEDGGLMWPDTHAAVSDRVNMLFAEIDQAAAEQVALQQSMLEQAKARAQSGP